MLTDLDEGEGGVRGYSKVSTGMSKWLVISLTERERIGEEPEEGPCRGKQESVDNEISFGHV